MKLSTQQKLDRAVTQLLRDPATMWLSGIIVYGTRELTTRVPTAATDGVNEFYNPAFVESLPEDEIKGLVLHEVLHKAHSHLTVWRHLWKQDAATANQAMDYVINLVITEDLGVKLPKVALLDPQYRGMDTEQVFRLLRKQQEKQASNGNGHGDGDGQQGGSSQQQGNGQQQSHDHHDWENAEHRDTADGGKGGKEAQEYIERALRQGEMAAKYAGHGDGMAERLGILQPPKVDWKQVLAEFLTETIKGADESTWRRPSRRGLAMGVYLPSRYSERAGELVLAIDTSGSIGGEELGQMLAETASLCQSLTPERVTLLYWGSHIAAAEEYEPGAYDTMVESTKPQGGGGTDARCVEQWLDDHNRNPQAVVIMTDGYVPSWPSFNAPTLWVITTRGITAQSGRTVTMEN